MTKKTKRVLKIIISIYILFVLIYIGKSELNLGNNSRSSDFIERGLKSNNFIISDPFKIDEAQDWDDLKSEGKCTGEGTKINPYIISNLKINGEGSNCIVIDPSSSFSRQRSRKHIRSCSVQEILTFLSMNLANL